MGKITLKKDEFEDAVGSFVSTLELLDTSARRAVEGLDQLQNGIDNIVDAQGGAVFTLDRFAGQALDSIHGIGKTLFRSGFGDAGLKFLGNFADRLGDDVASAVAGGIGGSFSRKLIGGILGELVSGVFGLLERKRKHRLPTVDLHDLVTPPRLLLEPISLLPSSAAFGGRGLSANINVTVNGIVGSARDVADEVERIVTEALGAFNRRGA